ncbi:MAG: sigma 54-interacting transcriptional regulator [Sorangiineae bacterium]|nr:sigma 54-interacting transcriptional regulator [Polyangiaceae bacterium]MEB2322277.1 sigma 54-interacting transcriptional regulator [Sorangiineae bacterium]
MDPRVPEAVTRAARAEAAAPEALVLVVVSGQARGQRLEMRDRVRIGKAPDNDLVLPDDTVSRHHCELERHAGGIRVRDLDSTNQTRVGDTAIREATLEPGARLVIGDVEVLLRSELDRAGLLPSEATRFGETLGTSLAMRSIFGVLERIAPTDAVVLLEGETGTGKDVIARSIHQESPRRAQPFVVVDCGAVSYNLIESELFGHERGAFTGAIAQRLGAFELAGRGTVFLDEVGELPLDVQPKLLRVLESGQYRRVGGNRTLEAGARIVAATKRNLREEVERGKFREDLYFRLAVVPVTVPPLRARREDIPALIGHFLAAARARDPSARGLTLGRDTLAALAAHDWPGNVRELRNVLDRAIYLAAASGDGEARLIDLPVSPSASPDARLGFQPGASYRETRAEFEADFERRYVGWLLDRHGGNVSAAAREAKMDRKHLYDLARKHGLRGSSNGD